MFLRALLISVLIVGAARAEGPTKAECLDAYTQGQQLKKKGELQSARTKLLICSRNPCPTGLQSDCSDWLSEVQRLQPSIVIVATDENGHEVTDVRVSVDDVVVATKLDGRAIDVDPGERRVKVEIVGRPATSQSLLIREGQKAREVAVRFAGEEKPPAVVAAVQPKAPVTEAPAEKPSSSVLPWITGGVTVAALGIFAGFGIAGIGQRSDLLGTCNHSCAESDKDAVDQKFLIADIALGAAVIAGAATAILLLRGRHE